jgi:hypothetical protein
MSLTIPKLIEIALGACSRFKRYQGDVGRIRFAREQNSLIKAIARFGHVATQRGWNFDASEVINPILEVIRSLQGRESEIKTWLPQYLECAIDRHIRMRAEEYSEAAKIKKTTGVLVKEATIGMQVVVERQVSHMEVLAAAYGDRHQVIQQHIHAARVRAASKKPAATAAKQGSLF